MQPESDFVSMIMNWKVGKDSLKVITKHNAGKLDMGKTAVNTGRDCKSRRLLCKHL